MRASEERGGYRGILEGFLEGFLFLTLNCFKKAFKFRRRRQSVCMPRHVLQR
jgi:hypothetical protein